MAEPDLKRVKEVYTGALEKPPQQRQAYIQAACHGDQQLKNKVERMLAATGAAADFMTGEGQIAAAETLDASPTSRTHPDSIGHYRIIRPIGEGGMGIVSPTSKRGGPPAQLQCLPQGVQNVTPCRNGHTKRYYFQGIHLP